MNVNQPNTVEITPAILQTSSPPPHTRGSFIPMCHHINLGVQMEPQLQNMMPPKGKWQNPNQCHGDRILLSLKVTQVVKEMKTRPHFTSLWEMGKVLEDAIVKASFVSSSKNWPSV